MFGVCPLDITTREKISTWSKGTLNGNSPALNSEGFSVKYKPAPEPHRLLMPNPIRTVTYVYMHTYNEPLVP
jgi:hypothetical protein